MTNEHTDVSGARTTTDWRLHAHLVGRICERATGMVSNSLKMDILRFMDELETKYKKDWSKKQLAKAEEAPKSGALDWHDIE